MEPIAHPWIPVLEGKTNIIHPECSKSIKMRKYTRIPTISSTYLEPCGGYHLHYREHHITLDQREAD
jgi:hypothetical protein